MKKIKMQFITLAITSILLFIIPSLSYAGRESLTKADVEARFLYANEIFACTENNDICGKNHNYYYGPNNTFWTTSRRKSLAGIYHAMRKNKANWVNTTAPKVPTSRQGTWWGGYSGAEDLKLGTDDGKNSMISRIGAFCFGHRSETRASGLAAGYWIWTFDIKETSSKNDLKIGYAAYKSHQLKETGGVASNIWKGQICNWIINKLKNTKTTITHDDGSKEVISGVVDIPERGAKDIDATNKKNMDDYADEIVKIRTMQLKSEDTQTIQYKNGYTFIGPYKIYNYNGTRGNLTKSVLLDASGNALKTTTLASLDGNTVKNISEIGSSSDAGYNFYVVVEGEFSGTIEKIKLYKSFKYYKARVVGTEPYLGGGTANGGQNVAIFYGYETTGQVSINLPGITASNIKITKQDSVSKGKLNGVEFVVYYKEGNGYLNGNTIVSSISQATKYTTVNGEVAITGLSRLGTYTIYEVTNPNTGYIPVSISNPYKIQDVSVTAFGQNISVVANNQPVQNLTIEKKDAGTGKLLPNVGFILYCQNKGYVVKGTPARYTSDKTKATVYITNQTGKIKIENLPQGSVYSIYEVVNPHFGYEEVSVANPKLVGTIDMTAQGINPQITINNSRIYVKLSGYVWEDMISQKTSVRNWLWKNDSNDSEDRRVNNVKVTLKKADGTVIDTRTTGTVLNSNNQNVYGGYIFGDYLRDSSAKRIKISDLNGAYIEFEYNGMCYQSVKVNTDVDNGNKATDNNLRSAFNENYATIVNGEAHNSNGQKTYDLKYDFANHISTLNYGGTYLYGYTDESQGGRQKYPIAGIGKQYLISANTKEASPNKLLGQRITINDIISQGLEEIPNINLGLYEREMPDMVTVEDIENVKITFNGYEHTYEYAQRISDFENRVADKGFNVTVSYGNKYGPSSYTRECYSSDVVYNKQNSENLGVYVTYRIALRNEATTLYTKVNEIENYYDERYDIYSVTDQEGNAISEGNIIKDESFNENGYKRVKINVNQDINHQEQKYIYIRYKLSNDAINSLLNGEATLNSVTEITSYSSFDNSGFTNSYAGVDRDSAPETTSVENVDTYEDDTDKAPSLILRVKEGRIIQGTVWEDEALQTELDKTGYDKQRRGDGKYTSNENVIQNVKVELLNIDVDASGNTIYPVATLYKWDSSDGSDYEEEASTYTDEKGVYQFSGVIPANYLIRYTYGNTSVIYDSSGNEIGNVAIDNYKSTIYRNASKAALDNYWYINETGDATRLSDAKDEIGIMKDGSRVDIVEQRTTSEEVKYETITQDNQLESIEANTSMFNIKLDYDVNLDNISKFGTELKFVFDNIDLGIVRRPMQNLDIRKEIAYVEVMLANGQTIISGDPRVEDIEYLKFMPDGNVHVEIDSELIQGATINVTYEIIVDNTNAEIDYNNEDYYYYGIVPSGHSGWKLATVTKLFDYLSEGLEFNAANANNSNWINIKSEIKQDMVTNGYLSQDAYDVIKTYNKVLATEAFATMQPGEVKKVPLVATKLLTNSENDFTFANDIEVNTLKEKRIEDSIPGNYVPGTGPKVEFDDDMKTIAITGPTGKNYNYLPYIVLGISSFAILGAGIIFIKKKVLD